MTQGFTKARWAFSIDGIEASGDGGSDAVNKLMEKYAANQTGLWFDGKGNFLTNKNNIVSWTGSVDETLDSFKQHYGKNLVSAPQFTITDFNNRDAALLIARLTKNTGGVENCLATSDLLPPIKFEKEEVPINAASDKYLSPASKNDVLANKQRIVACGASAKDDIDIRRIKKYNYAAMLLESFPSQINIDCTKNGGCPGQSLRKTVLPNYIASYGPTQFILATMLQNLADMHKDATGVSSETRRLLRLDDPLLWQPSTGSERSEIEKSADRARYISRQFALRNATSPEWQEINETEKSEFISKTGLSAEVAGETWNDLNRWKRNPSPNLNGEARAAFASKVILAEPLLKNYLMSIISDSKKDGAFSQMSEYFLMKNYRAVQGAVNKSNEFSEITEKGEENRKWIARQREIEAELALRVARLHNGDLCKKLASQCIRNVAKTGSLQELIEADSRPDGRLYATRFLNAEEYPVPQAPGAIQPVGDYFSLRCLEKIDESTAIRGGLEMFKLSVQ
jgi:hypothetical protein